MKTSPEKCNLKVFVLTESIIATFKTDFSNLYFLEFLSLTPKPKMVFCGFVSWIPIYKSYWYNFNVHRATHETFWTDEKSSICFYLLNLSSSSLWKLQFNFGLLSVDEINFLKTMHNMFLEPEEYVLMSTRATNVFRNIFEQFWSRWKSNGWTADKRMFYFYSLLA